jgi:hypothetical protein
MMSTHLDDAAWWKSSRSNGNGGNNCVEVAVVDAAIAVRDSKNPDGPVLRFTSTAWESFVDGAKNGNFESTH